MALSGLVSTREGCLEYATRIQTKIEVPKANLLVRQARNMKDEKLVRSIFAHRAQQELQMHQLQAQDELWLETCNGSSAGVEYEDYLKKSAEF